MKQLYSILFLLIFTAVLPAKAQTSRWKICGTVTNHVTRKEIEGAKVTLLSKDSVPIDTWTTNKQMPEDMLDCPWKFFVPKKEADYILRIEADGYETTYQNLHCKFRGTRGYSFMGETRIKRKKEVQLKEVAVKATLVKFYTKKDTMVFNADAFQLAEGSMLDALIKQLPGVELKSDGRILVNGRYVSSLLLNGDDFFEKDRSVMLDNLPAYMVKDVKVYEQSTEKSRFLKQDIEPKNLVMDVGLKRQYSIGWIANAEAGMGSEDRYMGRAFALRFTPQSRLSFFGNLNNVNESRKPGENNDWTPASTGGGLDATKAFGVDYQVKDVNKRYIIRGDAKIEHLDRDHFSQQTGENFLPQGNTYTRALSQAYSCNTTFNTGHSWQLKWTDFELDIRPNLNYQKWNNRGFNAAATLKEDPGRYIGTNLMDSIMAPQAGTMLRRLAINRTLSEYYNKGDEWGSSVSMRASYRLPYSSNALFFDLSGNYKDRSEDQFNHYRLEYPSLPDADTDYRNRWNKNHPNRNSRYRAAVEYHHRLPRYFWITPAYSFSQQFTTRDFARYRLDRLAGWGMEGNQPLGALPSEVEQLQQSFDSRNSEFYTQIENVHRPSMQLSCGAPLKGFSLFEVSLTMPLNIVNRHMDYQRAGLDTVFSRRATFFEPTLMVRMDQKDGYRSFKFEYNQASSMPSLNNLITLPNDENPLYITQGNAQLKNEHTHKLKLSFRDYYQKTQCRITADINYSTTQNAVAWGYVYDKTTGVKTTKPQNVNGNYSLWGGLYYGRPLDKARRLDINTWTTGQFYNSVDLAAIEGATTSIRSKVRTLYLNETVHMNYRINKLNLGAKLGVNWIHSASPREDFRTIDAANINYGLSAQLELPWAMQFYTDLSLYSRRGYEDSGMNTDDLVWNARLSKRVMKGRLTFMLDGFDILHNLSNVTRSFNAQGRVETYRNVIPRYFMLHAVYRLNLQPKKLPGA